MKIFSSVIFFIFCFILSSSQANAVYLLPPPVTPSPSVQPSVHESTGFSGYTWSGSSYEVVPPSPGLIGSSPISSYPQPTVPPGIPSQPIPYPFPYPTIPMLPIPAIPDPHPITVWECPIGRAWNGTSCVSLGIQIPSEPLPSPTPTLTPIRILPVHPVKKNPSISKISPRQIKPGRMLSPIPKK